MFYTCFEYTQNEGTPGTPPQIKYTKDQLFEAVQKGDLDKVREILTDPDINVNAKMNYE